MLTFRHIYILEPTCLRKTRHDRILKSEENNASHIESASAYEDEIIFFSYISENN